MSELSGLAAMIRSIMTDDDGNYLTGIENGITAEKVLMKMGYKRDQSDANLWSKLYGQVTVEINREMRHAQEMGYVAGGMSRNPTYYFIAREKNRKEQGFIARRKITNAKGHLRGVKLATTGMIEVAETKRLDQSIKLIGRIGDSIQDIPDIDTAIRDAKKRA